MDGHHVLQAVEEMLVAKSEPTVSSQPKKSKAKKSGGGGGGAHGAQSDVAAIVDTVQQASLSRDELQMLVERILAIQSEDEWTTKVTEIVSFRGSGYVCGYSIRF